MPTRKQLLLQGWKNDSWLMKYRNKKYQYVGYTYDNKNILFDAESKTLLYLTDRDILLDEEFIFI